MMITTMMQTSGGDGKVWMFVKGIFGDSRSSILQEDIVLDSDMSSLKAEIMSIKRYQEQSEHVSSYLLSSLAAVDQTLSAIVSQKLNIPTLFCLIPIKRTMWKSLSNLSSTFFSNSFMLMTVCPVTLKVVPRSTDGE